jgi:phosphoglycerate dehydrogenase-like enzyme
MPDLVVYLLAKPDDPGLVPLATPPAGVRLVVGDRVEAFAKAPPPDAIFACGIGRSLLEPLFKAHPGIRWVHCRFAGLDGLLFPELVESAVPLTNGRGSFSRSLGEFAVAGLLYFAKDFPRMRRRQAVREWQPFDVEDLHGRTLGIVGFGDIGRAIAARAKPFGMRIVGLRRRATRATQGDLADEIWPLDRLRELMAVSDDVAVALPLTPETHHLVGEAEIRGMKPASVFVNVGRGAVVDEAALVHALSEGRIKGAALDVFETEPLPKESPLWGMDNVLLSPHTADHTRTWLVDASHLFLQNLDRFRRGEPLLTIVDKGAGY